MIQYFRIWPLLVFLHAQPMSISPVIVYQYESDSEEYHLENANVHQFEIGMLGQYSRGKLNIISRMAYHLIHGINYTQSEFTPIQGLHFSSQDPGLSKNQRNYYVSDMQFQYGDSSSYVYLNKWDKHWGPGIRSLVLSRKIPTFPHFGFKWSINEQINIEYFHGQLKSNVVDTLYEDYYTLDQFNKSLEISRNIAGHRLSWQPHDKWIISISELVIYANRSLETAYLLPFIPFFPVQNYLNDTDNILMSADVQYHPADNVRTYGAFIMDEWSPPYTFEQDNHNWFGWQIGIEWKKIRLKDDLFRLEYTWTDHRIYHHRFEVNDYYSWGYPVGFWAGPHAEEIYIDYSFKIGNSQVQILFSNAKRGEFTEFMLIDQYGRPADTPVYQRFSQDNIICGDCTGTVESKQLVKISLYKHFYDKLDVYTQYSYIDWKNASFSPSNPKLDIDLPDIIKHSLGIGLRYRY